MILQRWIFLHTWCHQIRTIRTVSLLCPQCKWHVLTCPTCIVLPSHVHPSYPYGDPTNIKHPAARPRVPYDPTSRALFEDMGYAGGGANGTLRWKDLALDILLPVDHEKEEAERAAQARKMASGATANQHQGAQQQQQQRQQQPPQEQLPLPPPPAPDTTMDEDADDEDDENENDENDDENMEDGEGPGPEGSEEE